jgi:hypothetical protein
VARILISLEDEDRTWLEQRAREIGVSVSAVVHQLIRQARLVEVLASTSGLWRQGDGSLISVAFGDSGDRTK